MMHTENFLALRSVLVQKGQNGWTLSERFQQLNTLWACQQHSGGYVGNGE